MPSARPATALDGSATGSIGDNRRRDGETNRPRAVLARGVGARLGAPAEGTVEPLLARHGELARAYRGRACERTGCATAASREGASRSGGGAGRGRRVRVAGAIGRVLGRGPTGVAARATALIVQVDQRVQRERVVGVMACGQRCASALETPTVEIKPPRCKPLAAVCQTVVVDDLAQRGSGSVSTSGSSTHAVHTAASKYTGSSASSVAANRAPNRRWRRRRRRCCFGAR
jgi:hypothetical protein